jgi:kynurenine formamidase
MNRSAAMVFCALLLPACAIAQTWQPPAPAQRCPSKWGADDERGAANHMNAQTVLRASKLIKTGEMIELGWVLSSDMPLVGTRRFDMHTKRTTGPMGSNKRYSNEELVITELGQVGTQLDMFSHQGIDGLLYNCIKIDDVATRSGFTKLGVDKIGTLFTRAVLIDVAALKGVDMLEAGYEITVADLQAALSRQGVSIAPGDAVLIRTGWAKLWGKDNAKYNAGCPGIGVAAAEWLAKQDVMLMGADNFPVEVAPNPDKALNLPVHQIALAVNGIFLLENMNLEAVAARGVYEFALLVQPLKLKGGTGSTVAPVALF